MPHPTNATAAIVADAIREILFMSVWRVGEGLPCSDDLTTV